LIWKLSTIIPGILYWIFQVENHGKTAQQYPQKSPRKGAFLLFGYCRILSMLQLMGIALALGSIL